MSTFPLPDTSLYDESIAYLSTCRTFTFTSPVDELPLSALTAKPENPDAKKTILLLTGWNESYIKYWSLIRHLTTLGYTVHTLDHRTQGLSLLPSSLPMSHVTDFNHYVTDARAFIESLFDFKAGGKISIIGHSMGGLISLKLSAILGPTSVHSVSTVAPMLCFKTPPFPWSVAGVLGLILPNIGLGSHYTVGFPKPNWEPVLQNWPIKCSHSIERNACWVRQQFANPQITLAGPSNTWVASAWKGCDTFLKRYVHGTERYPVPWLIVRATEDRFVHEESQDMFAAAQRGGGRFVRVEGAYHEVLIECDGLRDRALGEITEFVKVHEGGGKGVYEDVTVEGEIEVNPEFEVRRMQSVDKSNGRGIINAVGITAVVAIGAGIVIARRR